MDFFFTILSFLVLFCSTICTAKVNHFYNVYKYGAVGNGQVDDSQAFIEAWNAACTTVHGIPTMLIPDGNFLLKQIEFSGPCKSKNVRVKVLGKLVAQSKDKWIGDLGKWLLFNNVDGLVISGSGTIDGQGASWWNYNGQNRPTALHLNHCQNSRLSGLTHINSPRNHISISSCQNTRIFNLNIIAPADSPNTDGIDISTSSNIHIHDLIIKTGDDCIAINDKSSFISIKRVFCGPGHGISVGSLGVDRSYQTVEDIYVYNCTFSGTMNGARIKTWQGGSGHAERITFDHIIFDNASNPIIIDQMYNPNPKLSENESSVQVRNVTYNNIQGTSQSQVAILFNCASTGCNNILMKNVNIKSPVSSYQTHAHCTNGKGLYSNVKPNVPCLSKFH